MPGELCYNKTILNFKAPICLNNLIFYVTEPCRRVICKNNAVCVVTQEKQGICRCPEKCHDKKDSVCGSDGKVYENECEMKQMSCKQQQPLTVVKKGSCGRYI